MQSRTCLLEVTHEAQSGAISMQSLTCLLEVTHEPNHLWYGHGVWQPEEGLELTCGHKGGGERRGERRGEHWGFLGWAAACASRGR